MEEEFTQNVALFRDFLSSQNAWSEGRDYKDKISSMISLQRTRLIVNINDLRTFNPTLANDLLQKPLDLLEAFQEALRQVLVLASPETAALDFVRNPVHIGLEGAFGELHTSPRFLSAAKMMSHMVAVEGIVTSCSLTRPKLARSVHYCEAKGTFWAQDYTDGSSTVSSTATVGSAEGSRYPTADSEGNALTTEFGLSLYHDHQVITLQEMPERAPPGQLPRAIEIILSHDLVDCVKPGDRVLVVGIFRSIASNVSSQVPATFRTVILGNNIRKLYKHSMLDEEAKNSISTRDLELIRVASRERGIFKKLARSLAPSIHGHEQVKQAILLMLLGGCEKNLANGTHIRGDINILLIGDPSTAKSQLLRFTLSIAPLGISTTGRGASGVGLTAAVVHDKETGDRRLEAGAMVLGDRGIVCVDEFDKMSEGDRVAIHEVMEQQTVTISKAGMHATLNARCSLLAAANPIWGQYRETASPQENIRLPDSLLSRFDLTFVILDKIDPINDRALSRHVLENHTRVFSTSDEGYALNQQQQSSEEAFNLKKGESFGIEFVKKYIAVAKSTFKPILSKAASDYICEAYSAFRQGNGIESTSVKRTFPVTPRTLETLIRLASAHAKCRFSNRIEKKDAQVAKELIEFCLYKEVLKKKKLPKKKPEEEDDEENDESEGEEAEQEENHSPIIGDVEMQSKPSASVQPDASVKKAVRSALNFLRDSNPVSEMFDYELLSSQIDPSVASKEEIVAVLTEMEEANQVMFRDDYIILI